jgi:hypothetical protein
MLEYSFLNRSTLARELIQGESAAPAKFLWPEVHTCAVNHVLGMGTAFAQSALDLSGADASIQDQLLRDRMHYLILHEIGHTLGMNHNMKATQILSQEQIQDPEVLESGILAGSVMDYPAVNYAPTEEEQTLFYTIAPVPMMTGISSMPTLRASPMQRRKPSGWRRSHRAQRSLSWSLVMTPMTCVTRVVALTPASIFMTSARTRLVTRHRRWR